jgi:hypothetical protein
VQKLAERVAELPQGRRSHAARHSARAKPAEVEKTATETDDVLKRADELAETGDLIGAPEGPQRALYGIR